MTIAHTLEAYLQAHDVRFDTLRHDYAVTSMHAAAAARLPGDLLAKSVLLEDEQGYVMAVLPSTHRVDIGRLSRTLGRRLGLATEADIRELFKDCDLGAMPALGAAYGIETIIDDSLSDCPDVYFEAGDHEMLVHLTGDQFVRLMAGAQHASFSHHV